MNESPAADSLAITQLLKLYQEGNPSALDDLIPLVYQELRRLAHFYLRDENAGNTIQPTVLVHEAFLQLFQGTVIDWQNRAHFFNVVGQKMRWLAVDHRRSSLAKKRGGAQYKIPLDEIDVIASDQTGNDDLLQLDEALSALQQIYPREAHLVELRFFVGLNNEQIATLFGVSERTVRRDWAFAKAWLKDFITKQGT